MNVRTLCEPVALYQCIPKNHVIWPNEDDLVDVKEYEPTDDEGEDVNDEQPRRRSNRRKKKPDRFGVKD